MSASFELATAFEPKGDQPAAIAELTRGVERGERHEVLLGITGSGKTFTIANVIRNTQKPTLILAPNKTLAAQLYGEMKELFPNNAVEYFVSYYDYYQPEAYVPSSDTYIDKDAIINTRSTACGTRRRARSSRVATSSSSPPSAASTASAAPRATTGSPSS